MHKLSVETGLGWLPSSLLLLLLLRLLQLLLLHDGQRQTGLGTRIYGVQAIPVEGQSAGRVGRRLAPHRTHAGKLPYKPIVFPPLYHRSVHTFLLV